MTPSAHYRTKTKIKIGTNLPRTFTDDYGQGHFKMIYPFLSVTVRIGPSYKNRMI